MRVILILADDKKQGGYMDRRQLEYQRKLREKVRKQKERKRRRALARRFFIITVILYIFIILAILFFFSISLRSCKKEEPKHDIAIEHNEDEIEVIKKKQLYYDDTFYIPLSAIEMLTSIKVTGDSNNISFILNANEEFAKFTLGTHYAEVNANKVELSNKSLMVDGELYLPFDFFTEHMQGFNVEINENDSTYNISLSEDTAPQFILKAPKETKPIEEKEYIKVTESPIEFKLDLSSYEEYMNPADRDAYLFIVSAEHPLTKDYVPVDLTGSIYTRSDRETRMLTKYACLALEAFLKEGEANGIYGVTVTSAYRSYEYQEELFQQEILIEGSAEEAAKDVNPPGISEHQTGLAVDMHNMSSASVAFGDTKEAKWLAENAHKFGYILRYPDNKTDITGINYEPWHFRYVGRYHATKMNELDMCLEEYVEYINQ